jgi:hypothetical protein
MIVEIDVCQAIVSLQRNSRAKWHLIGLKVREIFVNQNATIYKDLFLEILD